MKKSTIRLVATFLLMFAILFLVYLQYLDQSKKYVQTEDLVELRNELNNQYNSVKINLEDTWQNVTLINMKIDSLNSVIRHQQEIISELREQIKVNSMNAKENAEDIFRLHNWHWNKNEFSDEFFKQ